MSWTQPVRYNVETLIRSSDSRNVPPNLVTLSNIQQGLQNSGMPDDRQITSSDRNWKVKIAKRLNASLPYRRVQTDIVNNMSWNSTFRWRPDYTQWGSSFSNAMYGLPSSFVGSQDSDLRDVALVRLKRKIQSHSGSMNLLVPIAELSELRGTIRVMAELSVTLLKELAEIKRSRGKSAFKYASRAWLSYSFGMSPLISTTKSVSESIVQFLERRDHNAVLTGTAVKDWVSSVPLTSRGSGAPGSTLWSSSELRHKLSYKWTGGFHFPVSAANNYDAMDHFNIKLPALIPTAWELTPFSWIVDYFVNVGPFLDDVFVANPGNCTYLTCTRRYEVQGVQQDSYALQAELSPNFTVMTSQHGARSTWRHFDLERTVHSSVPMISLRFKTADEIGMHSINKLLNLASVLGSGLRWPRGSSRN